MRENQRGRCCKSYACLFCMACCTFWGTIMKPIKARWSASRCDCGAAWELRDVESVGICGQRGGARAWPADLFLPDADLPRTGTDDDGARPRASGNLRSGNRTKTENQP